jgi:hypothetical protein
MRLAVLALLTLPAAAALAADPSAEAGRSYQIEFAARPAALKAGEAGTLVLTIATKAGAHVDPRAPLKVTLAATPGLKLSKAQLGRADQADAKAEAPRFEVPFTATGAGAQEASATLDFFVCTDQWCVKQVRDVKLSLAVK